MNKRRLQFILFLLLGITGFLIGAWGKSSFIMMVASITVFIIIPILFLVVSIVLFIKDKSKYYNHLLRSIGYSVGMVISVIIIGVAFLFY